MVPGTKKLLNKWKPLSMLLLLLALECVAHRPEWGTSGVELSYLLNGHGLFQLRHLLYSMYRDTFFITTSDWALLKPC